MFWLQSLGVLAAGVAAIYAVAAAAAMRIGPWRKRAYAHRRQPVTILKPLCGLEPGLETCLRSFCTQDYPAYQIVFGVADANDPVLTVARRLQDEFDTLSIDVVVDPTPHGSNRKVSNLINMLPFAAFETLVVADSDILVGTDYLDRVVTTLGTQPGGLVTCAYRARPGESVWSRLAALFVNEWFLPSVLISQRLGYTGFGFGSTLALTRQTLAAAGGFQAVANELADDHALTARVRMATNQPVVLSDYIVTTLTNDATFGTMLAHETRWMRTIRLITPQSYFLTGFSFGLPVACAAIVLGYNSPLVWVLVGVALAARLDLHRTQSRHFERSMWRDIALLPLRGALNALIWALGFGRKSVQWRGHRYAVDSRGTLQHTPRE